MVLCSTTLALGACIPYSENFIREYRPDSEIRRFASVALAGELVSFLSLVSGTTYNEITQNCKLQNRLLACMASK